MTTLLTPISEQNVGPLPANVDEDVEPDAQWKESLRARIEQTLQPMVDKAREDRDSQLRGLQEGSVQWESVMRSYNYAMDRVRRLAQDQFNEELKIVRFERSLALGKEVEGEEFEEFKRRQQAIWDTIKKGGAERQQAAAGGRDSRVSNPNASQENGVPVAGVTARANGEPAAASSLPRANGEQDVREGPSMPHRDSRPLARVPPGSDPRPRDRTQSGGSDQILGTPGSYGARPGRSRGNSSVFADFDPTTTSASPFYDQGSLGRASGSSLSRTRPQNVWLPPAPAKDDPPSTSTSRTYAHATTANVSPVSPSVREGAGNDNGRTVSRTGSIRLKDRPSPNAEFDSSSVPRDRYGLPMDDRGSSRKGKEPERPDRPRQPSFTQQTSVHDIYARRSDSRTPARTPLTSHVFEDQQSPQQQFSQQQFPQVSPLNSRFRMPGPEDGEGVPIRGARRSNTSDQGSPENMRYGPQNPASARPIPPSRRSLPGDIDAWPTQLNPSLHPMYGPQSPPAPTASSSRPIPRPSSADDDPRRHSPSGAWQGSQSPSNALPFTGYDVPFSSSPRHRYTASPAGSVNGRRNSNGSRSVRSRPSRQEFWGPSDVAQRPLATFEEQSVASGSDSEEDYGVDLDDLWYMRERAELRERHDLTWKLVRDEQRRQERQEIIWKAEEARRLEEEARRKEEEARRKEEEARRKEEDARMKADEARRMEEEVRLKALEIQQKQEELARREAELQRREVEAKLQEEIRKREEAEARLQQWKEAEERRKQEEADRLERERREKEERERREKVEREEREMREKEERERREKEERERRQKEEKERREREKREKVERDRREKEDRERREKEERERKEKERREREEKERLEREQKARREKDEQERREREEAQRRWEREEWQRQQREQEEQFAREREAWQESRRREAEATAAAGAQARLESDRLQAERLAALEAQRQREAAARRQRETEAQRQREEAERREAEVQRQQELEDQQEREAEAEAKRQEEAQEQQRRAAEEQRLREAEEQRRLEVEEQRRLEVEEQRQREAEERRQRKAEEQRLQEIEVTRQKEEVTRRQEEAKRKREKEKEERLEKARARARQREEEARKQREAEEAQQQEAEAARTRAAEAERAQAEAAQPQPADDIAQFQDPVFVREQEAELARIQGQREARELAAKQREEEETKKREAAKKREEEESRKRAAFVREQEEAYRRAQAENEGRLREIEARKRAEDALRRKEQQQRQQSEAVLQEALRRSEEEWRMQEERRRRQDSVGSASDSGSSRPGPHYSSSSSSAPRPIPKPSPSSAPGDRSSSASSSSFNSSASFFSASSGRSNSTGYTSSASRTSSTPTASATPTGMPGTPSSRGWKSPISPATPQPTTATSTASSRPTAGAYQTAYSASSYANSSQGTSRPTASYTANAPLDEEEWARRQHEQARRQFEQFQREQEAQQRLSEQKAMRQLSKEEVIKLFEEHERRWTRVPSLDFLGWHSFPWPMLKQPNDPEQLTYIEIQAYVLSPHQSADKTPRERIKDYLRKWHPDRFETKLLPKVREDDREKVKEGAGAVARHLNKLLGSLSSSGENGLFG